jgi:cbb3-type cytochrome oxidase subunit 3
MTPTEFSLLAVTVSFTGLVLWVYWPGRRERLESYGAIPLDEDDEAGSMEKRA